MAQPGQMLGVCMEGMVLPDSPVFTSLDLEPFAGLARPGSAAGVLGHRRFHGVMVSTLDSESSDPSSSLGGTFLFRLS